MKKTLKTMMIMTLVLSGMSLASCENNKIANVGLSFYQENINFSQKTNDAANKKNEYELVAEYGTQIDLNNFTLFYANEKGESFNVEEKKDGSEGYVFESDLPTDSMPNVGAYTLKFTYESWTNIVDVKIEKKVATLPILEDDGNMQYTGEDFTKKIVYDKSVLEMINPNEERIEPSPTIDGIPQYYEVEFRLKDSVNYKWPENANVNESGNFVLEFFIEKVLVLVDVSEYVVFEEDEHYQAPATINDVPQFNYSISEDYSKTFTTNDDAIKEFADLVEVKIFKGFVNSENVVTEINGVGSYFLTLVLKDSAHYMIGTTTQTYQYVEYVCVAQINIG